MGIIIENRETTVTKITFLSGKEADVEIEIKTPELLDEKSGFLEKNIEKTKTEEKKYQDLDGDKNPDYKNEQDKYIDVIKKRRNIKIKKKKKIKERNDNEREIKF